MELRYTAPIGELRATGRTLSGVAMRYGEVAQVGHIRERIQPGAFGRVGSSDVILNMQHDRGRPLARSGGGGLMLEDNKEQLSLRANLPATSAGDECLELVRGGVLRGLSVEMVVSRSALVDGIREVREASLWGIGVVDRAVYKGTTVEVRRRGGGWGGSYMYNRSRVTSDRGRRRKTSVRPAAFKFTLDEILGVTKEVSRIETGAGSAAAKRALVKAVREKGPEVSLLVGRDYSKVIGSTRAGTLELEDTAESLNWSVSKVPETTYAKDLAAGFAALSGAYGVDVLYSIPPADVVKDATEEEEEEGNPGVYIEHVNHAVLRAISIVPRAPMGNQGVVTPRFIAGRYQWLI